MIIDHKNKVLIGTPAKTGSSSLTQAVQYKTETPHYLKFHQWKGHGRKPHGLAIPEGCEDYTRYMTIRHPLDRLVSLWAYHAKPYRVGKEWPAFGEAAAANPGLVETFNTFALWFLEQRANNPYFSGSLPFAAMDSIAWWRPPNTWLITLGESAEYFEPDHFIHLESYEEDLAAINPYFRNMPHWRSAGQDTSWEAHYSKEVRRLVMEDHAERDMARFDYTLGSKK